MFKCFLSIVVIFTVVIMSANAQCQELCPPDDRIIEVVEYLKPQILESGKIPALPDSKLIVRRYNIHKADDGFLILIQMTIKQRYKSSEYLVTIIKKKNKAPRAGKVEPLHNIYN